MSDAAVHNGTVGYVKTMEKSGASQGDGGSAPIKKGSPEAEQEKAKTQFETKDAPAYYDAVREEQEAYQKAYDTFGPANASVSKLVDDLQRNNKILGDVDADHKVVGYVTAAASVIALVLLGPVALAGATVVIGVVDIVNTNTKTTEKHEAWNETTGRVAGTAKTGSEMVEGGLDLAKAAKVAPGATEAVEKFVTLSAKEVPGIPVVSTATSVVSAVSDGLTPATEVEGSIDNVEKLNELGEKLDDLQPGFFDRWKGFDKELLQKDLENAKRDLKAYEDANEEYMKKRAAAADAMKTFIESARAAHVPIG